MSKWQYTTRLVTTAIMIHNDAPSIGHDIVLDDLDQTLEELGGDDWELVGMMPVRTIAGAPRDTLLVFKRPPPPARQSWK